MELRDEMLAAIAADRDPSYEPPDGTAAELALALASTKVDLARRSKLVLALAGRVARQRKAEQEQKKVERQRKKAPYVDWVLLVYNAYRPAVSAS